MEDIQNKQNKMQNMEIENNVNELEKGIKIVDENKLKKLKKWYIVWLTLLAVLIVITIGVYAVCIVFLVHNVNNGYIDKEKYLSSCVLATGIWIVAMVIESVYLGFFAKKIWKINKKKYVEEEELNAGEVGGAIFEGFTRIV